MGRNIKENINFRITRSQKQGLARLAAEQDRPVGELIREAVEAYLAQAERERWEAEARRVSRALAREAQDPASAEARELEALDAALDEFSREWLWEPEE